MGSGTYRLYSLPAACKQTPHPSGDTDPVLLRDYAALSAHKPQVCPEVCELAEDAGAQTALWGQNASVLLHYMSLGATDKGKLGRSLHIFQNSEIIGST